MSELSPAVEPGSSRLRRVGLVAVCALVGVLLGAVVASVQPARYEATARVLVGPIGGDRDTLDAAGLLSTTYADLVTSRATVDRVAAVLGAELDTDDVSAVPDSRARVISITAIDDDEDRAVAIANALSDDLIEVVAAAAPAPPAIGDPTTAAIAGQVSLLDDANEAEPVGNPTVLIIVGMGLLGVVAGVFADRLLPAVGNRVDAGFVESVGLPVVEVQPGGGEGRLTDDEWDLVAAQLVHECGSSGPFRSMAFLPVDDDPDTVSLFLHLAVAEARAGGPVTVTDADPDLAAAAQVYEGIAPTASSAAPTDLDGRVVVATRPGADDVVLGGVPLRLVLPPAAGSDLPARGRLQRIADALPGGRLLSVLCPPAGAAPSAIAAALVVDHVVLVLRTGQSSKRRVSAALEALESVGARATVVLQVGKRYHPEPVTLVPGRDAAGDAPSSSDGDRRRQFRAPAPSAG